MDQVVPEGLQVAPPAVSSSVSVPTGVLQGPVMGLPLIRLVRLVEALGVSAMENKVKELSRSRGQVCTCICRRYQSQPSRFSPFLPSPAASSGPAKKK